MLNYINTLTQNTNFFFIEIKGALKNRILWKYEKNLKIGTNINFNIHSQAGIWEQGRSPVGRVALIPTSVYITNKIYCLIETLYANIFCLYGLFLYANLRREEDIPTYGFSLNQNYYNPTHSSQKIQGHNS